MLLRFSQLGGRFFDEVTEGDSYSWPKQSSLIAKDTVELSAGSLPRWCDKDQFGPEYMIKRSNITIMKYSGRERKRCWLPLTASTLVYESHVLSSCYRAWSFSAQPQAMIQSKKKKPELFDRYANCAMASESKAALQSLFEKDRLPPGRSHSSHYL